MTRPMLGDLDLEQVQLVETDEDQVVTHHPVASLDGGFVQPLGRRAARVRLVGVLTAAPTLETLAELRTKFHDAQPVPFVSDISSATLVDEVLIEAMDVRELAGSPGRLEYQFVLREYAEPEPIEPEPVIVPEVPIPEVEHGSLSVTVVVEGDPHFDFDRVGVTANGTPDDGPSMGRRQLADRISDNVWFEEEFPAGQYDIAGLVDDNLTPTGERETLSDSKSIRVNNGEVAEVTLTLRRGAKVGTVFVIHFRFDSAFVEPCMRPVLRQVAQFVTDHPDEQLLIVGQTDLVGSIKYNQSLSERRGRSAFAFLTFGTDRQAAINEWNELRRARPAGVLPSSQDTWGSREYGQMLQDLGFFKGNIGGDLDLTDAAVRQFQAANGLTADGDVGDSTWPVLIEHYLAQDSLTVPADRFLPNSNTTGCDEGPLRWLGCSEQDPVRSVTHAWRPNRRTDLMFVKEPELPCSVPKPETLDHVPDGAGGGGWCLHDGSSSSVCCFVHPAHKTCPGGESEKWCRYPAEPGTFPVSGRLQFSDGSPVPDTKYVLIAPDGEYMDKEVKRTSGSVRAGTAIPGKTNADGRFSYDRDTPTGIYTFEVEGPFVIHREGDPLTEAKGNVVCARLDGSADLIIIVVDRAAASVTPTITGADAVVVNKPHTNPARQAITLGVSEAFIGTGTVTRSNDAVRFFDAAAGGNEILFDGTDNVFTDAQLVAGHQIFGQGERASLAVDDVTLTLAVTVGGTPGMAAAHQMTSVDLKLNLHMSRTTLGALPLALSDVDKVGTGRFIHLQDPGNHGGRAMLTVQQSRPAAFAGNLVLQRLDARLQAFGAADEVAAAGQVAVATPLTIANATIPADGLRFWVEGVTVSGAIRDTGFQIGLENVETDGDRVAVTVVQFSNLIASIPSTPAQTARAGAVAPANHTFTIGAALAASDFDEDPTVNLPLPLVENSMRATTPVQLSVTVAPVGVPVLWGAQRAAGLAAASGGDDAAAIVALNPNPVPTVTPNGANQLQATLLADSVGTFHVRPFVDGNGNGTFEHGIDREANIIMNLVLGRVTLNVDNSTPRNLLGATSIAGNGISVRTGTFTIGAPTTVAMHLNAQIDVVTGGAQGRRVIEQYFGGWINNEIAVEGIVGIYTDFTVVPPTTHNKPTIFAANFGAATVLPNGRAVFFPGDATPVLLPPPLLDSGRRPEGVGGDTSMLGTSRIGRRTPRPLGQRWVVEAADSPSDGDDGTHPARANAQLTGFTYGLTFGAFLAVWTNTTASDGATGDPADRAYAVVRRVNWTQNGQWTINPTTGAIAIVVAPTTVITGSTTTSPAVAAAATAVEVRPPAATNNVIARNAQT